LQLLGVGKEQRERVALGCCLPRERAQRRGDGCLPPLACCGEEREAVEAPSLWKRCASRDEAEVRT